MSASLHDLMVLTGYSRYEVRKLLASGLLLNCIRSPQEAECARFSRAHLLEACFVRAFDGCGVLLSDAVRAARIWIAEEQRGDFTNYFAWRPSRGLYAEGDAWTYRFDDRQRSIMAICCGGATAEEEPAHQSGAVIVINRGHIVRRIDSLLAGKSERNYADSHVEARLFQYRPQADP